MEDDRHTWPPAPLGQPEPPPPPRTSRAAMLARNVGGALVGLTTGAILFGALSLAFAALVSQLVPPGGGLACLPGSVALAARLLPALAIMGGGAALFRGAPFFGAAFGAAPAALFLLTRALLP